MRRPVALGGLAFWLLAALGTALPARAQFAYDVMLIPSPSGNTSFVSFGAGAAFMNDINGDGQRDFAILERAGGYDVRARVMDGATLATLSTGATRGDLSHPIYSAGDVDGDGAEDILMFSIFLTSSNTVATVIVLSGATGDLLHLLVSPTPDEDGAYGAAFAPIGDVDADGRPDVAVGAPGEASGTVQLAGQVHLYSGATGLLIRTLQSPLAVYDGSFGLAIAGLGDVDADGASDFVVGAPGEPYPYNSGRAYVVIGATGAVLDTLEPAVPQTDERFGSFVTSVGDCTGDGIEDFALTSRPGSSLTVPVPLYVYDGASRALIRTIPPVGPAVQWGMPSRVGDYNGDGVEDMAAAGTAGLYIFSGATGGVLHVSPIRWSAIAAVPGGGPSDILFGDSYYSVPSHSSVGRAFRVRVQPAPENRRDYGVPARSALLLADRTGDGWSEIAIPGHVFDTVTGEPLLTLPAGDALAVAGDLDGDGTDDLLVGDEQSNAGQSSGRVHVVSGATGNSLGVLTSPTPQPDGRFGREVAGGADLDGDSVPDLVVGTMEHVPTDDEGRVYVFRGADRSLLYTLVSPTPRTEGEFGRSIAILDDLDGDARPDLAIGAPGEGSPSSFSGRVHLFSGATGTWLRTLDTPTPLPGGRFGHAVASLGDIDGDGRGDVAVGALNEAYVGRVHVFSGATGAVLQTLDSPSPTSSGRYGTSLSGAGDADGDGRRDLLVGASAEGLMVPQHYGAAYLYSSASWERLATYASPSPVEDGRFGFAVALGDADGDGRADALIGAPLEVTAFFSGRTYLFLSPDSFPVADGSAEEDVPPAKLAAEPVWPNPASVVAHLRYTLPADAAVHLTVHDALGRRVLNRDEAGRSAGRHELAFDVSAFAPGVYVARLSTNADAVTTRFTVVR